MLKKIKIKGPGRPKRRYHNKHPFDLGKSRLFLKNKALGKKKGCTIGSLKTSIPAPDSNEEAAKILETVEALGMQLVKGKEETFEAVKNQLLQGNI